MLQLFPVRQSGRGAWARWLGAAVVLSVLAGGGPARAETMTSEAGPAEDAQESARPQRPWLYVEDPSVASRLRAVAVSAVSITASGASPTRPFASNLAHPGAAYELGMEVGLAPRLSLEAIGVTDGLQQSGAFGMGMIAGARVAIVDAPQTHLTLSAGYLRELEGANGAWTRFAFAQDIGRARLALTAHGEHMFARGRDALDVMVMAGGSYAIVGPLRAGVEYVAQDLEGALDHDETEGGVRHFVGPNVALELDRRRLYVSAGPAVGLSRESPRVLGRIAVAYAF